MVDKIECRAEIEEKQTGDDIAVCCTNDIVMNRQDSSFTRVMKAVCRLFIGEKVKLVCMSNQPSRDDSLKNLGGKQAELLKRGEGELVHRINRVVQPNTGLSR
jgi:hypothetical protein